MSTDASRRGRKAVPGAPLEPGQGLAVPRRLSPVGENYLQGIYVLREEGVAATPGQLADYLRRLPAAEGLGTSLPSVTGMVRRLARQGLVELAPGKEVRLTAMGDEAARDVVRRHRLAECLVVDILGIDPVRAHREAHRLEHGISHDLEERIAARLGYPQTCPFGHPIPGSGDTLERSEEITLDAAMPGREYEVTWVPEHDDQLLRFLVDNRVVPGRRLLVSEAAPYRGVVVIRLEGQVVALGYQAARIGVRLLPETGAWGSEGAEAGGVAQG